jgi:hypothetical protein
VIQATHRAFLLYHTVLLLYLHRFDARRIDFIPSLFDLLLPQNLLAPLSSMAVLLTQSFTIPNHRCFPRCIQQVSFFVLCALPLVRQLLFTA